MLYEVTLSNELGCILDCKVFTVPEGERHDEVFNDKARLAMADWQFAVGDKVTFSPIS
jgi:hypothetical protein